MCIKVYPNKHVSRIGYEHKYLSVIVHILEGDNDDNLKWPFIGTIKIELLNQLENKNHYLKRVPFNQKNNIRVGSKRDYPRFIHYFRLKHPLHPLMKIQYLKDDILYFRVSAKTVYKPWLECTMK